MSEIENWKILLLEAGDEEPVIADVPAATSYIAGSSIDFAYKTQPESFACAGLPGKSCPWPRGKVMGGSSSTNGMWYARGAREDYDTWANLGNPGWSHKDVLPYFRKSEDSRIPEIVTKSPESHGTGGYLTVEYFSRNGKHTKSILNAWKEFGLPEIDYTDGGSMIGTARLQSTVLHGTRQSANGAFIRPIRGRRTNLVIKTNVHATKIIIDPKTKEARGVEYVTDGNDKTNRAFVKKDVIASAGAIDSPKLLILGDLDDSYYSLAYWLSTHEGMASIVGMTDTVTFLQTPFETRTGVPDIQIDLGADYVEKPYMLNSFYNKGIMGVNLLNPKSRGEIKLNKTDPTKSPPLIYANYLTHSHDVNTTIAGLKMARKIFGTKTFVEKSFRETRPTGCADHEFDSEEYWTCVLQNYSQTGNHPAGTCKMGPKNDTTAVVDSTLKVYGVKNLRVIDGSIMPLPIRGNTNAPIIMIAEKASDMIKAEWL